MLRHNRIYLLLLAGAILLQCICMRNAPIFDYELPFFSGLLPADAMSANMLLTLYSIIPIPFLLMFFSSDMENITEGYGKLILIRCYGKQKLMLCLMIKTLLHVAVISLVMAAAFTFAKADQWGSLSLEKSVQGLTMYTLTMMAIILLQYLLELYVETQYANVIVIIGSVITLLISGAVGIEYKFINFLLFPNLAFAQRNGILAEVENTNDCIIAFGWILFVNIILGILCLEKIKKKDIY